LADRVADTATSAPALGRRAAPSRRTDRRVRIPSGQTLAWWGVGLLVIGLAVAWTLITGVHPAFDAYGWLVWGRQALHLSLDTSAAPSWKPLPFLFTLPYALTGRFAVTLWMITATAASFGAPVFAGRIAWRLARSDGAGRVAAAVGALFAGIAVLGIAGWWHFVLISTCDPMMVMLFLACVDAQLGGRRRAAWTFLVLTALGRPEAWPLCLAYGVWAWRAHPELRRALVIGALAIPVMWFGLARLTSPSFFISSDIDMQSTNPLHGNRILGVLNGFASLYELPMQIAVLVALAFAALRRQVKDLLAAGAAVLWLLVEVALGIHGWAPVPRYVFEPAAVLLALTGAGVGRLLANRLWVLRLACVAAVAVLGVTMLPHARTRARLAHNGIVLGQTWTLLIHRLDGLVERAGTARILACGEPVTRVSFQSILAWEMGVNVADVGYSPPLFYSYGQPEVLFLARYAGFTVAPVHAHASACAGLTTQTKFGGGPKNPGTPSN
jgi:hypothetical protein